MHRSRHREHSETSSSSVRVVQKFALLYSQSQNGYAGPERFWVLGEFAIVVGTRVVGKFYNLSVQLEMPYANRLNSHHSADWHAACLQQSRLQTVRSRIVQ
jgi:hypothetical protein